MTTQIKPGDLVQDKITGFKGIAVVRSEWLNGCIRIQVQPQVLHEGKPVDAQPFDQEQLELLKARAHFSEALPTGGDRPNPMRAPDPK